MFLPLDTSTVWAIRGLAKSDVEGVFRALNLILGKSAILAIASYEPWALVQREFSESVVSIDERLSDFFSAYGIESNRIEYPNAGVTSFHASDFLKKISFLQERPDEWGEFVGSIDHMIAYADCRPLVPLISFHDAFRGGDLLISGHFFESDIISVSSAIGKTITRVNSPSLGFCFAEAVGGSYRTKGFDEES